MSGSAKTCHFFRIPLEIRLKIYRNLLLELGVAYLDILESEGNYQDDSDSDTYDLEGEAEGEGGYDGDFYEYNFNDSGSERDERYMRESLAQEAEDMEEMDETDEDQKSNMDDSAEEATPMRVLMRERRERQRIADEERFTRMLQNKEGAVVKRYPAILRANRQIHVEASEVLYSELLIMVNPGDVVGLEPTRAISNREIFNASLKVWRHNPLMDPGTQSPDGTVLYMTPELDGPMYPHVFAKFQKVHFDADFDFQSTRSASSFFVNKDMTIRLSDEIEFTTLMEKSTIIRNFVTIISRLPLITSLEFDLDVEISPDYDSEIDDLDADINENEDEDEETMVDNVIAVANARATEMILECGFLDPLRELANVRKLRLQIVTLDKKCEPMQLRPKYASIVESIKEAIEKNCLAKSKTN